MHNAGGPWVRKTATSTGITEYTLHGKNIVHLTQAGHTLHFYYDAQGKPSIVIYDGSVIIPFNWVWCESFIDGKALVTYEAADRYANLIIDQSGIVIQIPPITE